MSNVLEALNQLQADHQVLYQKLRAYHWNVKGPMFFQLHLKFEELYTAAALHVDELAERALTLGGRPLVTMAEQVERSRLDEASADVNAAGMVRELSDDLARLIGWERELSSQAAEGGDQGTANLLDGMADGHEKEAWMLRAFLEA